MGLFLIAFYQVSFSYYITINAGFLKADYNYCFEMICALAHRLTPIDFLAIFRVKFNTIFLDWVFQQNCTRIPHLS